MIKKRSLNKTALLIITLSALFIFILILINISNLKEIIKLDKYISQNIISIQNPVANIILWPITNLMHPVIFIMISFILFTTLIYKKRKKEALFSLCIILAGYLLKAIIKSLIKRQRPMNSLIEASGYSFPSGHAMLSIILFSLIIYFLKDDIKNKIQKNLFITANIFLILLIGFSRIYFNVHWFSDVIGGFSLGLFLVLLSILLFKLISKKHQHLKIL